MSMTPEEIRTARCELGKPLGPISQTTLAKILGYSTYASVSMWERGLRKMPQWTELRLRDLLAAKTAPSTVRT